MRSAGCCAKQDNFPAVRTLGKQHSDGEAVTAQFGYTDDYRASYSGQCPAPPHDHDPKSEKQGFEHCAGLANAECSNLINQFQVLPRKKLTELLATPLAGDAEQKVV